MKYYVEARQLLTYYNNYIHYHLDRDISDPTSVGNEYHLKVLYDYLLLKNELIMDIFKNQYIELEDETVTMEVFFYEYYLDNPSILMEYDLSDLYIEVTHELIFMLKGTSFTFNRETDEYVYENNSNLLGEDKLIVNLL